MRLVRLDQEAAAGMKRGKRNLTSSRRSAGAALERELDQALAATFPASDPVAVDSAEEHRSRLKPKNRSARRTRAAARRRK